MKKRSTVLKRLSVALPGGGRSWHCVALDTKLARMSSATSPCTHREWYALLARSRTRFKMPVRRLSAMAADSIAFFIPSTHRARSSCDGTPK